MYFIRSANADRSGRSAADGLVHLVQQRRAVAEVEVLREVAVGLLAGLAVEGHVERDQARPLDVAGLARALAGRGGIGRLGGRGLLDAARLRRDGRRGGWDSLTVGGRPFLEGLVEVVDGGLARGAPARGRR